MVVLVVAEDSGTKFQQVEAPRVVATISAEKVDAIVTTDTFDSLEEKIIIGDLYVRSHGFAIVQEAVTSSGGIETCIESPSYDVGDVGVSAESIDVGLCSSITDSQPGVESCV